jgi:hypothetical protein
LSERYKHNLELNYLDERVSLEICYNKWYFTQENLGNNITAIPEQFMISALPIKEMCGENLSVNDRTQHINISILSSRNNYISHINKDILQATRMKNDTSQ